MASGSRVRWIAVFAVLLFTSLVAPVLAEPSLKASGGAPVEAPAEQAVGETPFESGPVQPPGPEQVAEAIAGIERAEAARKRELQEPPAVKAREESRDAFTDLTSEQIRELILRVFADQLLMLNGDPARYLSDVKVLDTYGESVATVSDEGDGSLFEAGIPVRAENEAGELKKVDLELVPTDGGFELANPLTPVVIPETAQQAISIGSDGLAITALGAEGQAQRLGSKDIYFPEAQTDTDLLVAPIASGVELFDQLRSPQSPESLHFRLDLPEGAKLTELASGGAEISRAGEMLAFVSPPTAVDAQGAIVPVELTTEGATITLSVPHRDHDFAYPILVDPAIHENYEATWFWGSNLDAVNNSPGIWQISGTDPTQAYILRSTSCLHGELCSPSGRGLFLSSLPGNIPANVYTQWYYTVPGSTTFIPSIYPEPSAAFNPFWRSNGANCNVTQYPHPYDYDGAFDAGGNWTYISTNRAQNYGYDSLYTKAKGVAFGISSGSGVNIPCWRNLMVGGVAVRLDDPENPMVSSVSGFPTGWIGTGKSFTATVNASDPGLGVQNVTISPSGMPTIYHTSPANVCPGTKTHPCPAWPAAQFNLKSTDFDEGEKTIQISATDPTGKVSNTYSTTLRVDRTPPVVTLGGQLAFATDEDEGEEADPKDWDKLRLPVYNLNVKAKDGSKDKPENKRSGVKSIDIWLDGVAQSVPWAPEGCPLSSCEMERTYSLKLNGLAAGKHTLKVVVKDQLEQPRIRDIEFEYIPATGMKDEYVMHYFPLDDGQGNEAEEEHPNRPELAVNVMNGNLVYREKDIEVEGYSADLEVERFYNSQLPTAENTEWGDGWTLAQTPDLEPIDTGGSPAPDEAELLNSSGAIDEEIALPASVSGTEFNPEIQASITKEADGGYELTDETGETNGAIVFNQNGRTEELRTGDYATVDYDYDGGELSEIAIDDPASTDELPPPLEEPVLETPTYKSSFGSSGSGNGQFNHPADVARDAAGNLWVVDQNNKRIQKFNAAGEYVSKFGASGSSNGQFNRPTAIAIDTKGNLWIADAGNNRIQKFNDKGEYLSKFGSFGTGNGAFDSPEGIAVDANGDVWVSDTSNSRVQKFSEAGAFIKVVGTKGSGSGQLGEPGALDVAPNGDVWIADWGNNRVAVFDEAGTFVRQFGSAGSGDGQFDHPDSIDVDAVGYVWVGEEGDRIQRFDETGTYVDQFGSSGSGAGQFNLTYAMGLAADSEGNVWVTDTNNHRVQRWEMEEPEAEPETPVYQSAFGSSGSGNGQFNHPADVARDAAGNLWVVDQNNRRVQKFNAAGEYLTKFGSTGTGNGQFDRPTAVAIDTKGNLWIADAGNNRIQKFNDKGEYLSKFGSFGTGNGAFDSPEGIAVDAKGNVWVSDTVNGRVQKFSEAGSFIKVVGSKGSGSGQLKEPGALDVAPNGDVWIADWGNNRVSVFDEAGTFVRQFGSAGTGDGQFNHPDGIDVDSDGNVWVAEEGARVQRFDETGAYVDQFGSWGAGAGQFKFTYAMGLTVDSEGNIWVADTDNHRVQRWALPAPPEETVPVDDDPMVEVATSGGLVTAVGGEEAGVHGYEHSGDDLVSHESPEGEFKYEYDGAGQMTKVTLPNETTASIAYGTGLFSGRVVSVTVNPAGAEPAKTTLFEYSDDPRRTVVTPAAQPAVTYDIGADGSILKWWNTIKPPEFADISGSLYSNKETASPINTGDQNLLVKAYSEEGITSIQFIANGNTIVDEKICPHENPATACKEPDNEWVTHTGDLAPGILELEILIEDRLGGIASRKFWVNIPYTPPPSPESHTAPPFKDILAFREEFGLDYDLDPFEDELEINDRVFDLIGHWNNPHTPLGEVARAATAKWGVPLRPVDIAELEYREWYLTQDALGIPQWASVHAPSTYAGYYVDNRARGTVYVQFTSNAAASLSALKASSVLPATDRVKAAPISPTHSLVSLGELAQSLAINPGPGFVGQVSIDHQHNKVRAGARNVALTESWIAGQFGAGAPIQVYSDPGPAFTAGHWGRTGPLFAGQAFGKYELVGGEDGRKKCTAGFGATEKLEPKPNQQPVYARFALTAGHCFNNGQEVGRWDDKDDFTPPTKIGTVARRSIEIESEGFFTDAAAVRLNSLEAPRTIVPERAGEPPIRVTSIAPQVAGMPVCSSGATGETIRHGELRGQTSFVSIPKKVDPVTDGVLEWYGPFYQAMANLRIDPGDSGEPIWRCGTGHAIGLGTAEAGRGDYTGITTFHTPAPPAEGYNLIPFKPGQAPGILNAPGMGNLNLTFSK